MEQGYDPTMNGPILPIPDLFLELCVSVANCEIPPLQAFKP